MKKHLLLLLLLPLSLNLYAQRTRDVLYLKNGSIIHGSILELHPEGNVKIQTDEGSLFVFPSSDINRLVIESAPNSFFNRGTNNFRKGYIGTSVGVSIPLGSFNNYSDSHGRARVGAQVNFVNFGYLFTQRLGIHATLLCGAYRYSPTSSDIAPSEYVTGQSYHFRRTLAYGGLLAGPLFAFPLTDRLTLDLRPAIGVMSVSIPRRYYEGNNNIGNTLIRNDDATTFTIAAGVLASYDISNRFAISLNTDIMKIAGEGNALQDDLYSLNISIGIAYKFFR